MSPTARSLALLRSRGLWADTTQRWVKTGPRTGFFRDLFTVADCFGFDARQTVLVQSTTTANMAAREKKVREWAGLTDWLAGGRTFYIHGWALKGPAGKRKVWQVVERELAASDPEREEVSV